ncbi:ROK family protein [Clostridium estertheticum]|uniref:ROK family protein n=1 Tax=Clostridium estertheticum TaxID=238834 RepID=UPI001C0D4769|nr:ROK family protein [Clostridium estertheticum]MBU3072601.1 ROK family protein [Clostridium estertheticum]MBU3162694.1 ROK family protein [Clostridium estertheticum]
MSEFIIGVDLGGTNIKVALFNLDLKLIVEVRKSTEAQNGPAYVLNKIIHIVEDMMGNLNITEKLIYCMGMGIPGLLDPYEGKSFFSPNFPGWENIHVVNEMKKKFHFPVFIDNDVRVNLYGEWIYGAGLNSKNLILITLGTGLGSGIVMDGKVMYGETAGAGEIGHMNMYREGRPCKCGSSGCLGRYVSAVGMVNTFIEKLNKGRNSIIEKWVNYDNSNIEAHMISKAYDLQDNLAIEVMHETGRILGFGLANVINLFNPEIIIVGGGMSSAGDRLLNTVRETINDHALKISSNACRVVQAKLGDCAGMIGAAAYARDKVNNKELSV